MRHLKTFCSIAIVTAFALVIAAPEFLGNCGQKTSKPSEPSVVKGLRLTAELVGDELFHREEAIIIKLKIENTSKSPVYVHKQLGLGPGGFRITILDANDQWVPPNFIRETFSAPVQSKEDLQAIEPGKAIEHRLQILLDQYEIAPGDHTLNVTYVSPLDPEDVTTGLNVLFSEDGKLQAKPIRFKVLTPIAKS